MSQFITVISDRLSSYRFNAHLIRPPESQRWQCELYNPTFTLMIFPAINRRIYYVWKMFHDMLRVLEFSCCHLPCFDHPFGFQSHSLQKGPLQPHLGNLGLGRSVPGTEGGRHFTSR